MADKKAEAAPPAKEGATAAPEKKKLPLKVVLVVAGIMAVEAGAVFMIASMGAPKASHAEATHAELHDDESEKTQEIELVTDKFQNMTTGQAWVWQISIYLQVKNKHADRVYGVLEQRSAEIREGLSQIIGRARHTQLTEPEKQTLTRQIAAFLDKLDGMTEEGKSIVERVIFADCRGFPTNF